MQKRRSNQIKKPIRILHVIHWPKSGIVSLVHNIISLMPRDEVESHVAFFYYDRDTLLDFDKICASTHCLNVSSSYLRGILHYYRVLKQISPDVLHTHSFQPITWGSLFSFPNTKHIATIHSPYPYFTEKRIRSIIKRNIQKLCLSIFITKVVAVTGVVYDRLSKLGIPVENLCVIENGVPLNNPNPCYKGINKIRKQIDISPKDILVITLGRLGSEKGYDILLKAFKEVYGRHANTVLMIIGDGDEKNRLIDLAENLKIIDRVRFLGFTRNPLTYLFAADIYVCSSLYEGLPLAVLEAMSCELPVVATRVGAIPDMIEHGVSGLLVHPGDPQVLAEALDDLICHKYDRKLMAKSARMTVIDRYDIQKTVDSYIELYERTIMIS